MLSSVPTDSGWPFDDAPVCRGSLGSSPLFILPASIKATCTSIAFLTNDMHIPSSPRATCVLSASTFLSGAKDPSVPCSRRRAFSRIRGVRSSLTRPNNWSWVILEEEIASWAGDAKGCFSLPTHIVGGGKEPGTISKLVKPPVEESPGMASSLSVVRSG